MWSARLATVIAGLILISVPAGAMKFEDYSGLTMPQHIAVPPAADAMKFSHAPVMNFRKPAVVSAAMKFADRPFFQLRRTAAVPARPAVRFEDRPALNPRRLALAPVVHASMRFEDRPGQHLPRLAPPVIEPLRFTDYCAKTAKCSPFDVAFSRALQLPEGDEARIAIRLDSVIARSRLSPAATLASAEPVVASADACRMFLTSKLDYFACLGLPSGTLRKEIGSPMFQRVGLIPRGGGRYHVGTPYRIGGQWFKPRKMPDYDQIGMASWYGHRFHGRMTANGEWFDMEYFTAAHPTLPLPCYARVVNLTNGKELVVRVNDRGPFVGSRLIDLSKRTAEVLEFKRQGIAKVRVQYIGPAPLDDKGRHLAAMNRELRRGTPLPEIIAVASDLRQQHAMADAPAATSLPAQAF
ncbi:MAG: septal ring lytic transglycosylase RlpA family protein [Aestuariivirgaceae bacterium]